MAVGTQNDEEARNSSDWRDVQREAEAAARDVAEEAQERGSEFVYAARDRATDYVERRKDSAAQSVEEIASTLRETGESLEDRPNVRMFVDSAAEGLEMLAGEIRERSLVEMVSDMEEFARRRPATFAAAAGVAGFVIARFLKSSAGDVDERRAYSDQMRYERAERRRSRPESPHEAARGESERAAAERSASEPTTTAASAAGSTPGAT